MLSLAYSIFQGNVGNAYRQRSQLLVFYFIFVAVGYVLMLEKREERKRRDLAEPKPLPARIAASELLVVKFSSGPNLSCCEPIACSEQDGWFGPTRKLMNGLLTLLCLIVSAVIVLAVPGFVAPWGAEFSIANIFDTGRAILLCAALALLPV